MYSFDHFTAWFLFGILNLLFLITATTIFIPEFRLPRRRSDFVIVVITRAFRPFIVVIEDSLEKFLRGFPPLFNLLEILLLLLDVSSSDGTGLDGQRLRGIALISVCSLIASLGGYNVSRLTRYNRYNTPRFQF